MRLYPQQMNIKGNGVCKTQGTHLKIHVIGLSTAILSVVPDTLLTAAIKTRPSLV
jgi:hypothetical protein